MECPNGAPVNPAPRNGIFKADLRPEGKLLDMPVGTGHEKR